MRKLVKDNDSILEWHPLFSENITEREIVEHAVQKTEQIMKMIFVSNTKVVSAFVDLNDLILTYSQFFAQELENHKSSTRFKKSFFTMLFFVLENLCDLGVLAGNVVSFFTLGFMDTTQVSEALVGIFDPTTPSVLDTPDFQEWINNEKVIQGLTDAAEKSKEYPYKYVLTFNNQSLIDDIQNQIRLIENLPIYRKGSLDPQSRYWDEVIKQLQMIADLNSKTEQIIKQFECIKNSYENTP